MQLESELTMADEMQALLNRLTEQELKKVDAQRQEILDHARKEADDLLAEARREAAAIREKASQEADLMTQKGQEALRQASRDVLIDLREKLKARVAGAVRDIVSESLQPQSLTEILTALVTRYLDQNGDVDDLKVLLPPAQLEALEAAVKVKLGEQLRSRCQFGPLAGTDEGFKLVFQGNDIMYDFSLEALTEAIAAHVSPKLSRIITDAP